ncbi:hypothetical protein B0J13DRAFT_641343 [Dactylonectria estremocensis]|uniref:Uncharacterized protein n=1 Tax=Dactylonectria estremocensis TaxID=1079267 RepID=A0A9P9EC46_9HYPO|nr:hypothetical protein B0J13DRAFT_641343 [Dactylonectria estremocensis]
MPLLCCCRSWDLIQGSSSCNIQPPSVQLAPTTVPTAEVPSKMIEAQSSVPESCSRPLSEPPQLSIADNHDVFGPQLVVDDSESDTDLPRARKKISGTFEAVKIKVVQHIRHGTATKRQSLASIGNSNEEVARRAELKRLMHKRIQDELQTEQRDGRSSNKSTPSLPCLSSVINAAMPTAGPRDNIEFAVNSLPTFTGLTPLEDSLQSTTSVPHEDSRAPVVQQNDRPASSIGYESYAESTNETTGTVRCLRPVIVSTESSPASRHLSFPHSTSQKSFQLSNSVSRLDRILGPDNGFSSRQDSSSLDGQSALGVWLIAQGLRSRENSEPPPEGTEIGNSVTRNSSNEQLKGVDRVSKTLASSIHSASRSQIEIFLDPEPMEDSKKLEQGCLSEISTQQSTTSDLTTGSNGSESRTPSQRQGILESCSLALKLSSMVDNTSSNYTSKLPSFQPSPARSDPNFYALKAQDFQSFQLSPFEWHRGSLLHCDFTRSEEPALNALNDDNPTEFVSDPDPRGSQHSSQKADDRNSLSHSETTSFIQRETELRTIQKRFGDVLARKRLALPITSRFHEEFEGRNLGQEARTSFADKIRLTVPRRFKVGSRSSGNPELGTLFGSSRIANSNSGLQETEIVTNGETSSQRKRLSNLRMRSNIPPTQPDKASSENRQLNLQAGLWRGRSTGNSSLSTNTTREPSQLTPKAEELPSDYHSKRLIQRWATEMRIGTIGRPEKIETEILTELVKPPRSWAKYPSHTKERRTGHATIKDNENPKDFAAREINLDDQVMWATDKNAVDDMSPDETLTQSFSMRMEKALKSKLTWILPQKSEYGVKARRSWRGRASSQGGKQLEYPELEILPTESGYEELQALEKEIGIMRGKPRNLPTEESSTKPKSVRSLGSRISALMFEAATSSFHNHDKSQTTTSILRSSGTPASGFYSLFQESTAPTDVFVTPQSRISFGFGTREDQQDSDVESTKNNWSTIRESPMTGVDTSHDLQIST